MLQDFIKRIGIKIDWRSDIRPALAVAALAFCFGNAHQVRAQVLPAAEAGRLLVSGGATGSGYYLQYGARKMFGVTGFVDVDTRSPLGVEFEGRWLEWNQTSSVHAETYSVGPRYHRNFGKFQPYVKGLAGLGNFNFRITLRRESIWL
jgi:hypothetical protein